MGWHEDHMNAVADRWGKRYSNSEMDNVSFSKFMRNKLAKYGWTEVEIDRMVKRALKNRR